MDSEEYEDKDIVDFSHIKKKRLIDSGDEMEEIAVLKVTAKPTKQVKKDHEKKTLNESQKKSEKKSEETQNLDKKKLKYLFEPDESLQETKTSEEEVQEVKRKRVKKEEIQSKQQIVHTQIQKKEQNQIGRLDDLYIGILNRWWYCLGEWPPENYDYSDKLSAYKLRKVEISQFKLEPEIEHGFKKVYQVDGYPGVFKTSAGDTLDLRPLETCPSIEKIKFFDQKKLPSIYLKGLRAQLEDLIKHEPHNKILQDQLKSTITQVQKKFSNFLN